MSFFIGELYELGIVVGSVQLYTIKDTARKSIAEREKIKVFCLFILV